MAIAITVPPLGWSMDEGLFAGWLKRDGDEVRPGEALYSIESDKATQEIESLDGGILRIAPDGPREGDKVAVGAVLGYFVERGEAAPFTAKQSAAVPEVKEAAAGPAARRLARELKVEVAHVAGTGKAGRVTPEDVRRHHHERTEEPAAPRRRSGPAISPRARRVAAELGLDWTQLRGSGRTGRIRERDVRAAPLPHGRGSLSQQVPISSLRRTIAARMLESSQTTAPVTLTARADATNLVQLRLQFKEAAILPVPSYTDFLVKLTALALKQHPLLNARWEKDHIAALPDIHIGIAVDTDAGLLVPVLRDVQRLGLREVAARSADLIQRARERKLRPDEMQGGTFTLTNLGAFGIDAFTPVINSPEAAILGVGQVRREPVAVDDEIVLRDMTTLSLTFDHRIVDGAPAARFLQTLVQLIKNPGPWLMA